MGPCPLSRPIFRDRHVAGPAEWRHDRHHVHPGLSALLPAPGLRRRHRPQSRVSTRQLEGKARGRTGHASLGGSSEAGESPAKELPPALSGAQGEGS